MRRLLISTALALVAQSAASEDIALILGNERYLELDRLSRGADVTISAGGLTRLGFDVTTLRNGTAETTPAALETFLAKVPDAERVLVALSGRFVTDGERSWLLPVDAPPPGILSVVPGAVSVESVLAVLARAPGRAVLMLGVTTEGDAVFDPWLGEGVGALDIPQGVTVLQGEPRFLAEFLADEMARPEGDLPRLLTEDRHLRADGFLPLGFTFAPPLPIDEPAPDTAADEALWRRVLAQDDVEAYRGYLRQFPAGLHVDEAEAAIAAILAEPFRDERLAEEALGLTRDQRRDIQADLTTMGFNTRGVDGIFGPGTRRAIANWQQENGFAQTGYVTVEQINRLDGQAARRQAELAAEAERQRQEALRLDRAYWEETGARGDEAGLRAYLSRYPEGLFAEIAADRIALIEEQRRGEEAERDRQAWLQARNAGTVAAVEGYLRAFPNGAFVGDARAMLNRLTEEEPAPEEPEGDEVERARAVEQALNLNGLTARLVESRLAALDMNPGDVDGRFDERTRRAIRRFQEVNQIPATGYLDERTLVLLLAGVIPD